MHSLEGGSRVIASSNDEAGLKRVAENCSAMKGSITTVPFDLSETTGIEETVADIIKQEGRIDLLLNIGGISQRALIKETPAVARPQDHGDKLFRDYRTDEGSTALYDQ